MKCELCHRNAVKGLRYCLSHRDVILAKAKIEEPPREVRSRGMSSREDRTSTKHK